MHLYVHVPFCARRCSYCDFAIAVRSRVPEREFVEAVAAEWHARRTHPSLAGARHVDTLYFGGGTPSRLAAADLCRILAAVPRAPGSEVTVECNPEDADAARFAAYRHAGVNRLSFGVQSTVAHVLAALGRRHGPEAVERAVELAGSAGFPTFNVDLIFGVAGETAEDWARTLDDVLSLRPAPPHVSAYALTVEPGTPLAADAGRHPTDDVQADRYEVAEARTPVGRYLRLRSPSSLGDLGLPDPALARAVLSSRLDLVWGIGPRHWAELRRRGVRTVFDRRHPGLTEALSRVSW